MFNTLTVLKRRFQIVQSRTLLLQNLKLHWYIRNNFGFNFLMYQIRLEYLSTIYLYLEKRLWGLLIWRNYKVLGYGNQFSSLLNNSDLGLINGSIDTTINCTTNLIPLEEVTYSKEKIESLILIRMFLRVIKEVMDSVVPHQKRYIYIYWGVPW